VKISDIGSSRMVLQVRNPKGHTEREMKMPVELFVWLRIYYKQYTPKENIFEGADKTESISEKTIQTVFTPR